MVRLRLFQRAHAIRNNQHMEAGALQERRQAIRNGRIIVRKQEGGSAGRHVQATCKKKGPAHMDQALGHRE